MKRIRFRFKVWNLKSLLFDKTFEFTSEEEANGFRLGLDIAYRELSKITNVQMDLDADDNN